MSQLFYLSSEQLERIKPFFPRSHGRFESTQRNHLCHQAWPTMEGCSVWVQPLIKLCITVLDAGVIQNYSNNILKELSKTADNAGRLMIDATHLKAHRTAAILLKERLFFVVLDVQKEDQIQNSMQSGRRRKTPAPDTHGRPSEDYKGASILFDSLPEAKKLLADCG